MDNLTKEILSDLKGAAKMMDQALNRVHASRNIWKEMKKVDEDIQLIIEGLEDGDYQY